MSKQYNKGIKRKTRQRYVRRLRDRKKTAAPSPAPAPAAPEPQPAAG